MNDLRTWLSYLTSGDARMIAAGALFLTIFAIERVPFVKGWINEDGWRPGADSADVWLSSKRKKLATNVVLAMLPAGLLLSGGAPYSDVVWTAITAIVGASGLNAVFKAAVTGSVIVPKDPPAETPKEPPAEEPKPPADPDATIRNVIGGDA